MSIVMTLQSTRHSPLQIQSRVQLAAVEFGQIEDRGTQRRFPPKDIELFLYYFNKNFSCNETYYEREIFSDSSLHHIFESQNLTFSIFY